MFAQSKALPGMIELITELKLKYKLKVAVVSNEGRELNTYRIAQFELGKFVDFLYHPVLYILGNRILIFLKLHWM